MTSPSAAKENEERKEVLRNDARMRDQERAATMHGLAIASADDEAGGRFARVNPTMVVGSTPLPRYPQASTPFRSDPVGLEPPLGYSIDALEHGGLASTSEAQAGPASDAPSPSMVDDVQRDAGPLSPSKEETK
jgi:hypothetical protein